MTPGPTTWGLLVAAAALALACGAPPVAPSPSPADGSEASSRPARCGLNTCGSDPDGNPCGRCTGAWFCHNGSCVPPCSEALTEEGCCDGPVMRYCFRGRTVQARCGRSCGWNPGARVYECGYAGEEPTGAHPIACPALPPGGSAPAR